MAMPICSKARELKTGKASSEVLLRNGAALTLGIDSSGTIYADHLLLQEGATKVDNMNGYSVHAADYRIDEGQPASQAVVRIEEDMVEVAALSGSLNVFDRQGALLTHIGGRHSYRVPNRRFAAPESRRRRGLTPNNNNRLKYRAAGNIVLPGWHTCGSRPGGGYLRPARPHQPIVVASCTLGELTPL